MKTESILTKNQKVKFAKDINYEGEKARIIVTIRYDDECGNGHNSFSITGDIINPKKKGDSKYYASGCIHEEITKYFPELKKYIKWHFMASEIPMHYIANTLYHAGDKDYNGKRKGEVLTTEKMFYFDNFPIRQKVSRSMIEFLEESDLKELKIFKNEYTPDKNGYNFKPKYDFRPTKWHNSEFDTEDEAREFLKAIQTIGYKIILVPTSYSEGKEPDLEAARSSAIAPDATLEQLQSKEWLEARIPDLISEFKKDLKELQLIF